MTPEVNVPFNATDASFGGSYEQDTGTKLTPERQRMLPIDGWLPKKTTTVPFKFCRAV